MKNDARSLYRCEASASGNGIGVRALLSSSARNASFGQPHDRFYANAMILDWLWGVSGSRSTTKKDEGNNGKHGNVGLSRSGGRRCKTSASDLRVIVGHRLRMV